MTKYDLFNERVGASYLEDTEYVEQEAKKLKIPIADLINRKLIKKVKPGKYTMYKIAKPWAIPGLLPYSRFESKGYGLNYRIPPRIESLLLSMMKKSKMTDEEIDIFWNSTSARHFADSISDQNWSDEDKLKKFFKKEMPDIIETAQKYIKAEKKKYSSESYHLQNLYRAIERFFADYNRGELKHHPKENFKWIASHAKILFDYVFEHDGKLPMF